MRDHKFLRPDVAIEPLFNGWYAWWYLLAPATAPLFVRNLHLKLMESFAQSPEIHVAALKNPALAGGPYLQYGPERVDDVKRLIERTRTDQADLLAFADAIAALRRLVSTESAGMSLERLYPSVPDALRGYVELVYDLGNHPSVRVIEPLLYRSVYYKEAAQSLSVRPLTDDRRPYVFSTPRLGGDGTLELRAAFRSEAVHKLFAMADAPGSVHEVAEALRVPDAEAASFARLFSDQPPRRRERVGRDQPGVRVRYFGHACVLLETSEVSLLTDPVIAYEVAAGPTRFSFADLPERIDYVLLTHGHADHLMLETLLRLRHRIGTIVVPRSGAGALADPSLRLLLQHAGFRAVRELDELETLELPGGQLTGVPFLGEHGDLDVRAKLAHLVRLGGASVLMAADSNAIEPRLYDHVAAIVGRVDALFLGMECDGAPMSWMYGPLLHAPLSRKADQSRRLNGSNSERAIEIIERLRPGRVCVYAMGREPWMGHVMALAYTEASPQMVEARKLIAHCHANGIAADMPYLSAELVLGR
jgi:L-ascorbate metabolism protein UlaG (beta-lactamase superfamily)